jgi:hypothetical protein
MRHTARLPFKWLTADSTLHLHLHCYAHVGLRKVGVIRKVSNDLVAGPASAGQNGHNHSMKRPIRNDALDTALG